MYELKTEYSNYFKEIRNTIYADYLGCTESYISSILSCSKLCSELFAKALISVRCEILIKDVQMNELLEKYFNKEK